MIFKEKIGVQSVRLALSALAGSMLISGYVQAQVTSESVQKIEITGSNIKRAEKEGTSPIQTITAKQISESGAATILELMRTVPAIGTGGYNDTPDQNGFSKGVATASLRGLGSTSTLILLNGRRMAPSAYVNPNNGQSTLYDLNTIPISALERVEIFKDGASAVYGSDAIGGVINFITKKDYQGGELSTTIGANDKGKFGKQNVNGTIGFGSFAKDGYNVFAAVDYTKRQATKLRDANSDVEAGLYDTINHRMNGYYNATGNLFSSVSNQGFFYKESSPGSATPVTGASVINKTNCPTSQQAVGSAANGNPSGTLFNRTFCTYDIADHTNAGTPGSDVSLLSRGNLRINDDITAFAEVAYTKSERQYVASSRSIDYTSGQVTSYSATGAQSSFFAFLPVGHPDNPFPGIRSLIRYRFENLRGGSETTNTNYRGLAGLKGETKGFDWETAVLWNRSNSDNTTFGQLYLPTLRKLQTQNVSLAALSADPTLSVDVTTKGKSEVFQWDAKASTEFGQLGGGAIGVAGGFEVRQEKLVVTPDARTAAGDVYGLANQLIDGSRTVSSGFMELRTPFTKSFEMDFAGRFDKYPDLKTNFVPKVGAKWSASDAVAFRGTYAKGFRAPSLSQTTPGGAQFFLSGLVDGVRCPSGNGPAAGADTTDCNKSISGVGAANPALKPEKSNSYSIGMVLSPTKNFDATFDFYHIRKEGTVLLQSAQYLIDHESENASNVVRDQNQLTWLRDANGNLIPNSGPLQKVTEPWINQGSIEVSGLDVNLALRSTLASGNLTTNLNLGYIHSFKIQENLGDFTINTAGTAPGLADWAISSGTDQPRIRATLSSSWTSGDNTVFGSINYRGPVSLQRRSDGETVYSAPYCQYRTTAPAGSYQTTALPGYIENFPDCSVSSWTTVNLGYSYTGFKNLTLSANISNLFDSKPPYDPRYATLGYNSTLDSNTGRYFNVGLKYVFK